SPHTATLAWSAASGPPATLGYERETLLPASSPRPAAPCFSSTAPPSWPPSLPRSNPLPGARPAPQRRPPGSPPPPRPATPRSGCPAPASGGGNPPPPPACPSGPQAAPDNAAASLGRSALRTPPPAWP